MDADGRGSSELLVIAAGLASLALPMDLDAISVVRAGAAGLIGCWAVCWGAC